MPVDILFIGDSTIDQYMKISEKDSFPPTGDDSGGICFHHGSKILVEKFETAVAGNAVNVALGAARLGVKTSIYTEMGDDQNGHLILDTLKKAGINTKAVVLNQGLLTNVHPIVVYSADRTIFSYHEKFEYEVGRGWPKTRWIYYTSLAENFPKFQVELVKYAKENNIGFAMNPGTIQMKKGVEALRNALEITDVLFVNREEALSLTGAPADVTVSELHNALHKLGPKLSVITDGKNGATAKENTGKFEQRTIFDEVDKPILDRTGAGDAFSSGFMAAIIHGKSLREALLWGAANSSHVIRQIGASKGLLTKKEMLAVVSKDS
jgi:sugar/nucleoside kinase (ribokinase family)